MLGIEITLIAALKVAVLLGFAGLTYAVLRLRRRHRREKEEAAALDNRTRSIFQPGIPDRAGDRSAELLQEIRRD